MIKRLMRKFNLKNNKGIGTYLLYGIGEILLVIIGILVAVQIDAKITKSKNDLVRCQYLDELLFVIEEDITDVEGNIAAFEDWNPKILSIGMAIFERKLAELDSLHHKLGVVGNYIHFGQGSKSKIEELKYSQINLITNRALKNKILTYQNVNISFLRDREERYDKVGEDVRKYYTKNFYGYAYEPAIPHDLAKLEKD